MVYALIVTIAAAVLILAAIAGVAYLARRAASEGGLATPGGWRFYPSPWVLLVLPILIAAIVWRFVPGLLIIPFVLPFALRGRGLWTARNRRRASPANGHADDGAIEGQYRPLDDR